MKRQRGVALITVLLVFALVAVIAAEILRRSQLNVRSVAGLIDTRQAYYYALAGEAYARQALARDITQRNSRSDTLIEPWAQTAEAQPFEIDNGEMKVEIRDLQARFNLNSVVDDNGAPRQEAYEQLRRLMTVLGLNPNYAAEWLDWVDRDQAVSAGGAEDAEYENRLTPGGWEGDVSALRQLRSMQPDDYLQLAPHVAVLPVADSKINVNTADAAVLQALSPIISGAAATAIVARQQTGGYATLQEFEQSTGASGANADVRSDYFEVLVTVSFAGRWQRVRTVLQRIDNQGVVKFKVLNRVRSPLIDDGDSEQ